MGGIIIKEVYETPCTEVLRVNYEGIICSSELNTPSGYPSGGDPFIM